MSVYLHGKRIFSPAAGLVEEHIDLSAFINRVQLKQSKAEESADLKKPNAWSDASGSVSEYECKISECCSDWVCLLVPTAQQPSDGP